MGEIGNFTGEKLIIGILTADPELKPEITRELEREFREFGEIDYQSSLLRFDYTDYYDREMGNFITRFFVSFKELADPSDFARIKIRTNKLEKRFVSEGKRKVNLDPGMLSLDRLMLATTKNNGHRIPLNSGIYAEVTLMYVKKDFQDLPWTYADYRSGEYKEILREIRKKYKEDLKRQG